MMRDVHFDVKLFKSAAARSDSEEFLLWLLGVLARWNRDFLLEHPDTPRLYESGVVYALPDQVAECRVDPGRLKDLIVFLSSIGASAETIGTIVRFLKGIEVFRDVPTLYGRKRGDCDNLAAARIGELWAAGIMAGPCLIDHPNPEGGTTYHAVVLWPGGSPDDPAYIEDPSLILGMGGSARADERREEIRKNVERYRRMLQAAQRLMMASDVSPELLGRQIDAMGLIPRDGVFRC